MMQIPNVQSTQALAPNYNAVKIDIHNPSVGVPNAAPAPAAAAPTVAPSAYDVPKASIYEVPNQSVYGTSPNFSAPPAAKAEPSTPAAVPTPVIVPPVISQPTAAPTAPAATAAPEATAAPAQPVEVKAPEVATPKLDVNAFLAKLSSADYEEQANAMESIASLVQDSPQKATELLDVKVVDTLLGIMGTDSSKLEGPTPKQLEIREKIIGKQPVTDAEIAEASKITPMEQAERNKQYAIYTVAILQKLFGSEIQKLNNTSVPLTELPGAAGIVEQLKNNPNPMVRASAVDALSYNQQPEYKQDLTTLFTIAQKDKDVNVQQAATKALEKLNQLTAPAAPAAAAPVAQAA